MKKLTSFLLLLGLALSTISAQEKYRRFSKEWRAAGPEKEWNSVEHEYFYQWRDKLRAKRANENAEILRRQKAILNGNKITTEIWNYGSISSPGNRVTDIVWEGLGYGYEFGPFIGAEIPVAPGSHQDAYIKKDANGDPILNDDGNPIWMAKAISDGLVSLGGEISPDGKIFWGWEPLAYNSQGVPYGDPNSPNIPTSNDVDRDGDGKPDSWPEGWYNPNLKSYVWPGALRQGSSNADLESFFVVDDRSNQEFKYYPFDNDSTKMGLGIEIECRYYQWSNPMAEDVVFLIYKVTNKSNKDLNEVVFGMWGDPHIGGPSNWQDDLSYFDTDLNMVYAWDEDGKSDVAGRKPGYFGYIFLESPGNPYDGKDNDGDGMVDESRNNGIDDDGDWDLDKDDVGIDGIPNTGDVGENDGIPSAGNAFDIRQPGEPNFEWTDLDESDMIGLTSFAAPNFGGNNRISKDHYIYSTYMTPGRYDSLNSEVAGDNIFLYGSGNFTLKAGEARRFSIALLVGNNFDDLTLNAKTARQIYDTNYQFAKPPEKPTLTAVPGDQKVTLYWDDIAESSWDPISEEYDFEGYVIYRSTDPSFLDQQNITDINGSRFLFEPLKTETGGWAKWDLINEYKGPSDIPYDGRGVAYHLGNNTGLIHSFVDSNNVINGQRYYYAICSYDHGTKILGIGPSESSKTITLNPETNEIFLDINTAAVVPREPAAGYTKGFVAEDTISAFKHVGGFATGDFAVEILDPMAIEDTNTFQITFSAEPTRYSIEDLNPVIENRTVKKNVYITLKKNRVNGERFILTKASGAVMSKGKDYLLFPEAGQVVVTDTLSSDISEGEQVTIEYTHYPLWESKQLNNEESNPVIDGVKLYVRDKSLALNDKKSKWIDGSTGNYAVTVGPYDGKASNMRGADYEIRWFNDIADTSSLGTATAPFQIWDVTHGIIPFKKKIAVLDYKIRNKTWDFGESVVILEEGNGINVSWQIDFNSPQDIVVTHPIGGD
ncbi:MAG: hypothetical protein HN710_00980, partial [Candidatus Marinimicrobia bacterium]|nr:hypothetical protein [Candidatus Neomarinimicrobiota bacterium]MBT3675719.1 hypothetical protein [Candidatus Neomarinimicrobiota bacterium]MBT3763952.1 hypothetical protein [Candidatus Neomarinimicrobiota bacterium]MBT4810078.1 hypothetical protein [Candidatus Neomarinimicrobiota bacterium]MBT5177172.1 hypothetical protein [Candidatus Neomarinimicrobiota bacterium]